MKEESNKLETLRHSTSHVLAAAVLEMFPEAKFAIGPAIEDGFYYDFELPRTLIPEDLPLLEEKMKTIIKANHPFEKKLMKIDEAIKNFEKAGQPYKAELIRDLEKEGKKQVMVYKSGSFVDLCSGPHLESTGEIRSDAFKLTKISGAYWRGDEKKEQLQRIYGVAFDNKKDLKKYLALLAEAEKRNHRTLGKQLGIFALFEEIGQGLPVWLPNGFVMRKTLEDYMYQLERSYGYQHVLTPHINKEKMFEKSGHLGFYKESMYRPVEIDNEKFYLKPMNCPATMLIYRMKPHSYRDLPLKIGEMGTVYRYEKSGELHGLQRVRGFTINDAHIFCTPKQLEKEFDEVIEILERFMKDVGFNKYRYRLSLRDGSDKFIGDPKDWEKAQNIIRQAVKKTGVECDEAEGEAAFYGPKLDVQAINVFGKEDTISTIQVDFNLPERFDLDYVTEDGGKQRPFVIHRALIGSFERFFAFLIEHYAGAFPVWLAPVQAIIIPVSDKFNAYAEKVANELSASNIRVEISDESATLGKKIANATKQKIPYLLVVGEKEEKDNSVAVRERAGEKPHSAKTSRGRQQVIKVKKFIQGVQEKISPRS